MVILSIAALLAGCAAVEWQREYPGLQENAPRAVIKQKNHRQGNISSYIRGFYTQESMRPDEIKLPTLKNYSPGKAIAKTLFTFSPYGLATLPFADIRGNKISVPLSRLGIAIQRRYYKEISRNKLIVVHAGDKYYLGDKSLEIGKSRAISVNIIYEGTIFEVDYEELEWEDVIWAAIEKSSTYVLDLGDNKLYDNKKVVVGGADMSAVRLPADRLPLQGKSIIEICTNKSLELGKRAYFSADGTLVIEDAQGTITNQIPKPGKAGR